MALQSMEKNKGNENKFVQSDAGNSLDDILCVIVQRDVGTGEYRCRKSRYQRLEDIRDSFP